MPHLRSCLITIVIAAFLTFAYASAVQHSQNLPDTRQAQTKPDKTQFEHLLSQVSDESLHDVLHKYMTFKYQHGVYPEDRKAVQAIHDDNPATGTSLVELARRQSGTNTTAPTTTPASTVVLPSTTETQTELPTTTAVSSQEQSTSSSLQATTPGASTTTPSAQTTTSTTPAATSTGTTSSTGPSSTNSINTSVFVSVGGGTTDSTTTRAPTTTASVKSQEVVYTTTLPNGARSTVTYVTVIAADATASTPGITATGAASLQNSGDRRRGEGWAVGLGALGAIVMAL